jgi:hypothetical protein
MRRNVKEDGMNQLSKFLCPMVLLTGVFGACNVAAAAPAGATVFQRTENTQSIELSNIEDEGAPSVPVAVETKTPINSAKAVDPIPTKTPALPTPPKVAKKKSATDGTDDEEVAEGDEPETRQGRADANRAGDKDRNETVSTTTASFGGGFSGATGSTGGTTDGTAGTSSGGSSTTSAGNSTGASAGTTAGTSAGTGSSTGTATTAGTGGSTGSGSVPSVPAVPPTQTALETKLVQYRDQLLQEVANAQVANPAVARRYQMTDKATFQSRAGL